MSRIHPRLRQTLGISVVFCSAATIIGCGGGTRQNQQVSGPRLRHPLPPGFTAPGTNGSPSEVRVLDVRPPSPLRPSELSRAPQPAPAVRASAVALVIQPVPIRVQPLLTSQSQLRAGANIVVAAGRLSSIARHSALFVLLGPGYRAQRLVAVRDGIAAGVVRLPASMAPGTWALGVEDLSELHVGSHHQVHGTVILDLGIFALSL